VHAEQPTTRDAAPSRRWTPAVHILGGLIALAAVAFCVRAVVDAWPEVRSAVAHADVPWLLAALAASAAAMTGLGLLWWHCLHVFGVRVRPAAAVAWHFAGELGKYLPGGVWAVLGRGEAARRGGGVGRGTAYATTLISYACMTVAAAVVCGVLAPMAAADGSGIGWGWLLLALVPVGVGAAHPAVLGRLLAVARRVTGGRIDLEAPPWPVMLRLIAIATPTWLLLGAASVAVTEALGFAERPSRVAFAAIAAWIVGFLTVPVPAGAGVREVVFVVLCGLPAGPGTAVAAIARALLIVVDGVGGLAGLAAARRFTSPAPSRSG
jgi:uncharacterized membrane protein YbhN (UPF0104 family)